MYSKQTGHSKAERSSALEEEGAAAAITAAFETAVFCWGATGLAGMLFIMTRKKPIMINTVIKTDFLENISYF